MPPQYALANLSSPAPPAGGDLRALYQAWLDTPAPYKPTHKRVAKPETRQGMATFGCEQASATRAGWAALDLALKTTPERVWVWSDLHLYHNRICEMSPRPFPSVGTMNQVLLDHARAVVGEEDWLVCLGDLSFGGPDQTGDWLDQCPGRKAIILGNHDLDRGKPKHARVWTHFEAIADVHDVSFVSPMETDRWGAVDTLWLTHYPLWNTWVPEGVLNLHGHIHSDRLFGRRLNFSVEQTGYGPVRLLDAVAHAVA